ncbi:hypothetical protein FH972_009752 [Carpinus fangiana]|uniref:Uncharacterized protein n=1 Tax=Carpinus fangiana TaxID=176857 RepID=A0A660KL93_9ROSI|nr:hypothetical protein FH972_009752 [Carpinus fangiana]
MAGQQLNSFKRQKETPKGSYAFKLETYPKRAAMSHNNHSDLSSLHLSGSLSIIFTIALPQLSSETFAS